MSIIYNPKKAQRSTKNSIIQQKYFNFAQSENYIVMELKDILSISGYSGLFKYVSQARNGIIVEGLEDKKRMIAYTHYRVVSLGDIAIYTEDSEIPLREVFKKISEKEQGGPAMGGKVDEKQLKAYFEQVVPQYDKEKVHVSDMKKIINWYNILQRNGINNFEESEKAESITDEPDEQDKG
ncbi:MAG TPA: DUF5606 domain-containing protein [Bacteroidales bacterium]|nr:DUF5606 domain-containing protein [Bacteroidales bacterium]